MNSILFLKKENAQKKKMSKSDLETLKKEFDEKILVFRESLPQNRYQIHFNIVAENNNWNDSEKAAQLASSLRGKAQVILENLSNNELKQIDKVTELLDKKFNERQFSRTYYNQLLGLKQKYDQDFSNFAEEIEKLTNLAHYNLPNEARDRIACFQFINGIHNSRIEFTLRSERIESLYEAVERASELLSVSNLVYKNKKEKDMRNSKFNPRFRPYEYHYKNKNEKTIDDNNNFEKRNNNRNNNYDKNKMNGEKSNKNKSEIICYKCKKLGHYANSCEKNKNNQQNKNKNNSLN